MRAFFISLTLISALALTSAAATLPQQTSLDFQLNAKIYQQLRKDLPGFNPENYTIFSQYGQVNIQARVRNKSEAEDVMRIVRNVSGVSGIVNQVVVDPNM